MKALGIAILFLSLNSHAVSLGEAHSVHDCTRRATDNLRQLVTTFENNVRARVGNSGALKAVGMLETDGLDANNEGCHVFFFKNSRVAISAGHCAKSPTNAKFVQYHPLADEDPVPAIPVVSIPLKFVKTGTKDPESNKEMDYSIFLADEKSVKAAGIQPLKKADKLSSVSALSMATYPSASDKKMDPYVLYYESQCSGIIGTNTDQPGLIKHYCSALGSASGAPIFVPSANRGNISLEVAGMHTRGFEMQDAPKALGKYVNTGIRAANFEKDVDDVIGLLGKYPDDKIIEIMQNGGPNKTVEDTPAKQLEKKPPVGTRKTTKNP